MKFFNQIVLAVLFMSIGAKTMNALMAVCLIVLFLVTWILSKKGKLRIPQYFIVALCIYAFFLALGLANDHPNITRDVKFQFFGFLFYLFLLNAKDLNILRLLFVLNIVVCFTYIFIYLGLVPSLWSHSLTGKEGRMYGPSIIPILLIGFYYLYRRKAFDMPLAFSWLLAVVYLFLTSNLMNLVTAGVLLFLIVVDIRKIFKPVFLFGFSFLLVASIAFFNSDYAPEAIKTKVPYIIKPMEYGSLKTRKEDFNKALLSEDFKLKEKIIGEGFGVTTTIYRKNELAPSWSGFYTFLEIDNGFYYLYHRGGYLLLGIFILINFYLLFRLKNTKAQFGFIIIVGFTCLLSIHYFVNMFYLLIPFLILEGKQKEQSLKSETINLE